MEKADAMIQGANEMKSEISVYGTEQYNKGWDEAMVQAGSNPGGDPLKIYTEAEMNQILNEAKAPLEAQIVSLNSQVESFPSQLESSKSEGKVEGANELRSQLKSAYEAQQVAETEGETGFGALLG